MLANQLQQNPITKFSKVTEVRRRILVSNYATRPTNITISVTVTNIIKFTDITTASTVSNTTSITVAITTTLRTLLPLYIPPPTANTKNF
jgi:hypothetical protein